MKVVNRAIPYLKSYWFLLTLFLLCVAVKLYFISDDFIYFWYDQARDATIARRILEEKDIKIQGPSASGTKDQIYHGVLYYYLIGPLYTLSSGSPKFVSLIIIILTSLFVFPVYALSKSLTNSELTAKLTTLLSVFSIDAVTTGVWLSNPVMLIVSVPLFYYLIWQVFFKHKTNLIWFLALVLGVCNQAALSSIYLQIVLIIIYIFQSIKQKKLLIWKVKHYLIFIGVYLITILTMILTQLKMFFEGSFSLKNLWSSAHIDTSLIETLKAIAPVYLRKIELSLLPNFPYLSLIILLISSFFLLYRISNNKRFLYLLSFFGIGLFLFIHFRDAHHGLIGLTPIILLPISYGLSKILDSKKNLLKLVAVSFLVIYVGYHLRTMSINKQNRYYELAIQKGFMLKDQLALIDQTYKIANGKPFSISTLTIPYGWNTTWGYLYNWYGQKKFGYKPLFLGPDQTGIFGQNYLISTNQAQDVHFTIYEPEVNINQTLFNQFVESQNQAGLAINQFNYSQLILEQR
ncbi:MAG: hypothetical protein U9O78_04460 [Patescibacteria group bacterium]|nr:hypothetical protein [Patescibacteria group bacterium]